MKKILFLITLFVLFIVSCSNNETKNENVIGVSISTLNNPFFVDVKEGILKEAKEKGYEIKVVDAQNDPAKQISDVEDLLQQGIKLLIVNPVDSEAIGSAIVSANNKNIPVIAIDRNSTDGEVKTLIASDNVKGGELAAQFILDKLGKDAKVIELEGIPGASATRERGKGFHNIADNNLNILTKQTANFDRGQGLQVSENLLQAHKDVQAIFAHNDEMALGAIAAAESQNMNLIIVGFDGNDDAKQSIKDGKLTATIAQQPIEMGKKAIEVSEKILKGETVDKYIPVELKLITK